MEIAHQNRAVEVRGRITLSQPMMRLESEFEANLDSFLAMRNTFVHRLPDVPGWDMDSETGLQAAEHFLMELDQSADHVGKVFHALVREWEKRNGIANTDSDHPYFQEVDASYLMILPLVFGPKDDAP